MSNFEDTLVNPNISTGNYKPLKTVLNASNKKSRNITSPTNNNFKTNSKLENKPANIFAVTLFTVLAVTFIYIISQTF